MEQSAPTSREVTVPEAVKIAIHLQRAGRLAEAEEVYAKVLRLVPGDPEALHYSGLLAHQQGRSDEGVALIQRSLEIEPDRADWHSNLGVIFKALGRLDEAIAAYRQAIALNPEHANAHNNLGIILKALGRPVESEEAYRAAVRLDPEHIEAYHNLGILLESQKRTKEAVLCYCKVTTLSPKHPEARTLLAMAYRTLGELDKAVEIFAQWLAEEPDNPVARHMLAACSSQDMPARASDAYVERTFDGFAASFDEKLAHLSYQAPALVEAMLADSGVHPARSLDVLDAGCGTGLCGPRVAPYARRLVGVDLSGGMLQKAQAREVYDELVKSELTAYLRAAEQSFDVIVSADTLVYFGALDDVVTAAAAALRPGGMFVFSVEEAEAGGDPHRLQPHGRYTHTRGYLMDTLACAGLQAEIVRAELRMESGAPVAGLVVRATKPAEVSRG